MYYTKQVKHKLLANIRFNDKYAKMVNVFMEPTNLEANCITFTKQFIYIFIYTVI